MKDKVKNYVESLFTDVYDTKQLRELKEEISSNLTERINDFIEKGNNEDEAFKKAVSSLGDMSELVESLKKASQDKFRKDMFETEPLDKKHKIGYVAASAVLLFGIMTAGIVYLQQTSLYTALATLMPFVLIAAPIFIYMGLTQETMEHYGMSAKRAVAYTAASEIVLFGALTAGIIYFQGQKLFVVISTAMPFVITAAMMFIYLGLTEKSRIKMDSQWQKHWIEYYSNPQSLMLRGNISGAL